MDDLMFVHQPVTYVVELDRDDIAEIIDALRKQASYRGNTSARCYRLTEVHDRLVAQVENL